MKNLDVSAYEVSEMNAQEAMDTGGGFWGWLGKLIVAGAALELITEGPGQCWEDFKNGFCNAY